jgi:hypothetical protein
VDSRVVSAQTSFGFRLFGELRRQQAQQNTFVSPASIALGLAMTYNGAAGETKEALAQALAVPGLSLDDFNRANAALLAALRGADPSVKLEGVVDDPVRGSAREELRHGGFLNARLARVPELRRAVREEPRRLDRGRHIRDLPPARLEIDDPGRELLPFARKAHRLVERGLGDPERLRGDADSSAVEARERDPHSHPFRTEQILGGNTAVLEDELDRRRRLEPHFLLDLPDREALEGGFEEALKRAVK